ncbi:glycosyltransferase [Lacicoccus alkaliphilus]|uniref:4,4'-diaponeurosporenoate glycosyltransferase n=1 Tax=Lacicoccus alkaliphilus DSM 16010 TaxID=1123231 RepID=A0A1M7DUG7_9BACL|nr:glycosyltransferase [Salinicoccus alkaliphilus]SHL83154.1 4,4'-diaponeurosporenoate glycosyltransferase [Salinicoccus alkaliphilus DSM 16010]
MIIFTGFTIWIIITLICGALIFKYKKLIDDAGGDEVHAVSIIIPARNEAGNLPVLLQSIRTQKGVDADVIVADDGSTDQTAEIAGHFGADVISVPETELPGKYFACFTGSRHAGHPLMLFLDADTHFTDDHSVSRLCAQYTRDGGRGALSVQPFHHTGKSHETLSAVFNLMTVAGINIFSVFKNKYQSGTLFGPVILTNKKDYEQAGGHMAAAGYIIEGEGLYRAYTAGDMPVSHYLGKRTVHFRMYSEGFQSMVDGWKKHISIGSENTAGPVMAAIMIWLSAGLIYPIFLLYTLIYEVFLLPAVVSAYLISSFQFHRLCRPLIDLSGFGSLFFPVYQYFFFFVYALSLYQIRIRKTVKWKDREMKHEK